MQIKKTLFTYIYFVARTELRLISESAPAAGRVEVNHNGLWGSICSHSFDIRAARVICRMLGFAPG